MYHRTINIPKSNSFFLFGARGVGKSSLLRTQDSLSHPSTLWIDLLQPVLYEELSLNPSALSERIAAHLETQWVVIDEVQRCPELLNLVHWHIEDSKAKGQPIKFALTGSSVRKLKRGQANLLAGRAWLRSLYPLTHTELAKDFSLQEVLRWGSLPGIYEWSSDADKIEFLKVYCATYLAEEIVAEQVVRRLQPFRKFLQVAAQANGKIINASKIGRDIGSDYKTVQNYFQILEDTMIGYLLHPFHDSFRKRLSQKPKFYFFDPGVARALSGSIDQRLPPETFAFGNAFEHWVILEIIRHADYTQIDANFSYLRTKDDVEVDLIVEVAGKPRALIEIKSTKTVTANDLTSLTRIHRDLGSSVAYCLSNDPVAKKIDHVNCLPWDQGIKAILN